MLILTSSLYKYTVELRLNTEAVKQRTLSSIRLKIVLIERNIVLTLYNYLSPHAWFPACCFRIVFVAHFPPDL